MIRDGVLKLNCLATAQTLLNVTYVWLGGRKDIKGTWIWSDGQNFSYANWANGINNTGCGKSSWTNVSTKIFSKSANISFNFFA